MSRSVAAYAMAGVVTFVGPGCGRSGVPTAPEVVRLVDMFKAENVSGSSTSGRREIPRTEWRFDTTPGSPTPSGKGARWEAGPGVGGLTVKNGHLFGRTTAAVPLLHVQRTVGTGDLDLLHAVEIKMRVSAGGNVSATTSGQDKLDLDAEQRQAAATPWPMSASLTASPEVQIYTLVPTTHLPATATKHLILRPSDVSGAEFEIESIRVIFRREYLASIASGITWQGLKEVYRESIAAHAPETVRLSLRVPDQGWLDVGVGTIEDGPVTFRVSIGSPGQKDDQALAERTVTTPHRWEPIQLDLARFAGQTVTVSLTLAADEPGALGFWGSPVVRSRSMGGARSAGEPGARRPRGIILMQADTLRRDHLGLYGYDRDTAPALRKLAAEGTVFNNYTVQATWTKVSTPSLMTSLYPTTHGVADFADHLPASASTLAESLRAGGYATLSFSSVLFTGQFTNLHKGFEELHEDGSVANPQSSKTAREFVDRLALWLETHRDVPYFAFLHVFDPHDPYEPHHPYDTLWADAAQKDEHERQSREVRKVIKDPLLKAFGMPTSEELVQAKLDPSAYVKHDIGWYDGSIRGMDVEIARLFERLRTLGLDEDTLFVFLSDHGEEFLDHGRMFHGQTVYGELTQTPLVVRWPAGLPKGRRVDEVVQTIDVMPTLLELGGVKPPEGLQGQSLVPLLKPPADARGASGWKRRPAISEKAKTTGSFAPPPHETESYSIVDGEWKLIHNVARPTGGPEYELYDFVKDPLNKTNVASQHTDVVARLGKALDGWHQMATSARLKPDSETTRTLTPQQLQRLRSLGYVR